MVAWDLTYGALFLSAFVAATILPAQSEAVLAALLLRGAHDPFWLVVVAGSGNVLGSCVNWLLGRGAARLAERLGADGPVSRHGLDRAVGWYRRFGRWSLLASWLPIVGDPLTLAAGFLKEPWWSFLVLVGIAKFARYAALALVVLGP